IVLRRFLAPSDSRLWRILALLRRGIAEEAIREATGIAPWFLAEMARNVRLEAAVALAGRRLADADDAEAMSVLATAKRARFGDREPAARARSESGRGSSSTTARSRPRRRFVLRAGRQ